MLEMLLIIWNLSFLNKESNARMTVNPSNCFVSIKIQNWISYLCVTPSHCFQSGPLSIQTHRTMLWEDTEPNCCPSLWLIQPLRYSAIESCWSCDTDTLINPISQKRNKRETRSVPHWTVSRGSTFTCSSSSPVCTWSLKLKGTVCAIHKAPGIASRPAWKDKTQGGEALEEKSPGPQHPCRKDRHTQRGYWRA